MLIINKIKLIGAIFTILFLSNSVFGAWSWKYYQIYTTKWNSNKSTIYNGIMNNTLSSSYYINAGSLSNSNNEIERKEGDILFVVQENGVFNSLDGFTVTDYNGSQDYFTAIYNGKDFASTLCSTFQAGRVLTVYKQGNSLYKNVTVGGVTKKIKIATLSSEMSLLASNMSLDRKNSGTLKVKLLNGYTTRRVAYCSNGTTPVNGTWCWGGTLVYRTVPDCRDPKSLIDYRLAYYTRYKRDVSKPEAVFSSLKKEDGTSYTEGDWVNQNVILKLNCKDNPDSRIKKNSGCLVPSKELEITSHLLDTDEGKYWSFYDQASGGATNGNLGAGYYSLNVPIDKTKPFVSSFNLVGKNDLTDGYRYLLSKSVDEYNILADKYNFNFVIKDKSADTTCTSNCRGISGVKYIKIYKGSTELSCSRNYPEYNPTKGLVPEFRDDFSCDVDLSRIGNTGNKNITLKVKIEDYAGNIYYKDWTLHVKPNKPYPDNFGFVCMEGCSSSVYSTNEENSNDYYKFAISIKDRFGNLVKKRISDITLTNTSYIDKNTYDEIYDDDGNAITMYDKILGYGIGGFKLKSIVPGDFKTEFDFKIKKFDQSYTNESTYWIFKKYFSQIKNFSSSIKGGDATIYDMSGNLVTTTGLETLEWYKVQIPITSINFDDLSYSYEIGEINPNTFVAYPTDLYETIGVRNISGNIKNSGSSPSPYLTFEFRYNMKAGGVLNKTPSFKFNPSITLSNNGNTGVFPLYPGGLEVGTGEDMRFKFSVIGFKTAYGQTYAIGQGKKQFNIVPAEVKAKVKQNAYNYINSLNEGVVTNGILVKNGDYSLTSSEYSDLLSNGVKTLIIRNGNLTISTNITKRLDIAVVVDNANYEISSSTINTYLQDGNIKIKPNVTFINGLLYAEKSILTVDNGGNVISSDTPEKYTQIKKQLLFYGTIIARNSVGGSIMDINGDYMLPGGKRTDNLYLASIFDIAFLRRGSDGFDQVPNSKYNNGIDDYVIVRYNPDTKLNPGVLLK